MKQNTLSSAGAALGSVKSERKSRAARENGKLGGRPAITDGERVGHYFASHGFLRSYHGTEQMGSTASNDGLREYHERICRAIEARLNDGRTVREFFGGYYAA